MKGTKHYQLKGVIPASLMPFGANLEIDEAAYRSHLRELALVDGISAITINGHAAEVHALTLSEQERSLELAQDEVGDQIPLIVGISTPSSIIATQLAITAARGGASALLVFPPESMSRGGQQRPEMAIVHFESIANYTDLPLILFQYPLSSGLGYPLSTLLDLCQRFPTIRAIKDWCNDPVLHELHIRELHALDRSVAVLTTHSAWLLSSLVLGCDGLLSGAGSVIADLQVAIWRAIQAENLGAAQQVSNRLYHLTQAFYCNPLLDMHNRMKEALVLLGRLPAAHVRPPLVRLQPNEVQYIGAQLELAGISKGTQI
ncbi:MAG: dihydrodipicolinate synthase family protein [Candidatus Poribacteria bacterium]|jgi:4-hydroxy-tetrahydrodipicolinate synthase